MALTAPTALAQATQKKEIKDQAEYNAYVAAVQATDVNAKISGTLSNSFHIGYGNQNDGVNSKEGSSALHEAARNVQLDLVKHLLELGADPNLLDADKQKPVDVIGKLRGAAAAAAPATALKAIKIQYVGASDFGLSQFGRTVTLVSFPYLGKYKIVGTINDQNLVELVDTWIASPFYGDMNYEMRYTQYKDFNGIKFPMLFHTHQGDPRLNVAHNFYEYKLTTVKMNMPVQTMPVPDIVKTTTLPQPKVVSESLAPGVWLLGGGSHNSLLIEFKDYVAIVDAPNNEDRSLAVIAEANRLVPGKLVQYVINTHHHFDHSGGLRTYVAEGAAIVTHQSNIAFFENAWRGARTVMPDRLAQMGRQAPGAREEIAHRRMIGTMPFGFDLGEGLFGGAIGFEQGVLVARDLLHQQSDARVLEQSKGMRFFGTGALDELRQLARNVCRQQSHFGRHIPESIELDRPLRAQGLTQQQSMHCVGHASQADHRQCFLH